MTMPFIAIAVIVVALVALAAIVIDAVRSTARRGGYPGIALTYRAYSA